MYIKVRAHAGAQKELVQKHSDTSFEMRVKEKAEQNMANRRIVELLRIEFPDASIVKIVSGHHSPSKIVSVE